jgi:hypothetical protein
LALLWWLSGGMTPYTSESGLISLYIKYLCGLLVQPEHIEMILMGRIFARKNRVLELLLTCS